MLCVTCGAANDPRSVAFCDLCSTASQIRALQEYCASAVARPAAAEVPACDDRPMLETQPAPATHTQPATHAQPALHAAAVRNDGEPSVTEPLAAPAHDGTGSACAAPELEVVRHPHAPDAPNRDWWLRRRAEFAHMVDPGFSEHQWWMRHRDEYRLALESGLPPRSVIDSLASYDTASRFARATMWAAGILVISIWLAVLPLASHRWTAEAGPLTWAPVVGAAVAIAALGLAGARRCAMSISGSDAWGATLVNAAFWGPVGFLVAAAAVTSGRYALWTASVYAIVVAGVCAAAPVLRGRLADYVPRD